MKLVFGIEMSFNPFRIKANDLYEGLAFIFMLVGFTTYVVIKQKKAVKEELLSLQEKTEELKSKLNSGIYIPNINIPEGAFDIVHEDGRKWVLMPYEKVELDDME